MKTSAWLIVLAVPASLACALWQGSVAIPAHEMLAALGGSFLAAADALARSVAAPIELPVGVTTALIGVPALLTLLMRSR